jgi:hypothetical protein
MAVKLGLTVVGPLIHLFVDPSSEVCFCIFEVVFWQHGINN